MLSQAFDLRHFSLVLLIITLLSACGSETPVSDTSQQHQSRPAKLITLGQDTSQHFLSYPAVIRSQQLSALSFEVGGKLSRLLVVEAQAVNKGDVLAKLDQRDLQAKLKSAQAQYNNADAEYQRAVRLMKEDAISRSALEQRKSTLAVNDAGLETAKKALQDSVLIAPYDGHIARVSVKEKQTVQAGKVAISILGEGGLEATINFPASILAQSGRQKATAILEGSSQEKDAAVPAYIALDVAPNHRLIAHFKEISLEADAVSQTYALTFSFEAPADFIVLPGMNATVWFRDPSLPPASINSITIPLSAIAHEGEQAYVWLVNPDSMQVSRKDIRLEDGVGTQLEVLSGLVHGDTLVAAGVSALSEGMTVRPWSKQ